MGTQIALSLNDINIDYGKNRSWKSHYWLFPPGSEANVPTEYVSGLKLQPGYEASLAEVRFRLCHLGYSSAETRGKFEGYVHRWQRTDKDLQITYDDFHEATIGIEFATLTTDDLKPYGWDFRDFVIDRLAPTRLDKYAHEDFIYGLDFTITLRALCDRPDNLQLPVRWQTQDLIDSGWVTLEDLKDIDRQACIINHTLLCGRIQDYVGIAGLKACDTWLQSQGLRNGTPYKRSYPGSRPTQETLTLPVAVRHKIHHPENAHNTRTDEELRESTEALLDIAKRLPPPGLGLA